FLSLFLCNDTATPAIYTLSLHDALPIFGRRLDAIAGQHINQALLHEGDQFAYAQIQTPQIQHQVGHELAGTVVGHLPAALDLYQDRKSTRLNSSHVKISYAVFCLKKKNL